MDLMSEGIGSCPDPPSQDLSVCFPPNRLFAYESGNFRVLNPRLLALALYNTLGMTRSSIKMRRQTGTARASWVSFNAHIPRLYLVFGPLLSHFTVCIPGFRTWLAQLGYCCPCPRRPRCRN